jgi:putative ABC transport system substrate-binding protein
VQDAARALGQQLVVLNAGTDGDIDAAFTALVQQRAGALLATGSSFISSRRDRLIALASRHAVPAIYQIRDFPAAGGLISYGASLADAYRQAGVYAGRVLKGDKPSDLPVLQPTKFALVINLKTAKALGLELSPSVLALADEVIE